jgi:hypothetical protein
MPKKLAEPIPVPTNVLDAAREASERGIDAALQAALNAWGARVEAKHDIRVSRGRVEVGAVTHQRVQTPWEPVI